MNNTSLSSGVETLPIMPVHWEDVHIPEEWRENRTYQRGHGYCPRIGALDIETSTNDEKTCAWLYLWTFAVDDLIVYGRTVDDLKHWLHKLAAALDLKTNYRLATYIHNAKYDLTFLKHSLDLRSRKKADFIARTQHQIIRCCIETVFEMRDSAVYSEMPLAMMGDEIGLPKLEEDHTAIRTPETELKDSDIIYCGRDSHILTVYYRREAKEYGGVGKIPLTATGKVRNLISYCFNKENEVVRRRIYGRQLKTRPAKAREPKPEEQVIFERNRYVLDSLRKAFFGGYCYYSVLWGDTDISPENGAKYGMISADLDACYASMMLTKKYPMERFTPMPEECLPRTHAQLVDLINGYGVYENRAMLLRVRLDHIESRIPDFGFLPNWYKYHANENGISTIKRTSRIRKADSLELVLTDVDFRQLIRWYKPEGKEGGITVLSGLWSVYGDLPDYIIDTIIILYMDKKEFKTWMKNERAAGRKISTQDEIEYQHRKTMLARLYGVFVQDPVRMLYSWDEEKHKIIAEGEQEPENAQFSCVLYQWGVWVAAHARACLLDMCAKVGCTNGVWDRSLLYCDTDCVRWIVDKENQKELYLDMYNAEIDRQISQVITKRRISYFAIKYGIELSYDALQGCGRWNVDRYERYKQIGIKQYCYVEGGEFKCKLAGLSRQQKFFDLFDSIEDKITAFSSTLYIPAIYTNLKKTVYIEHEVEIDVTDLNGKQSHIVSPSSVVLIDTDYKARENNSADVYEGIDFEEVMIEFNKLGVPIEPAKYGMG